MVIPAKSGVPMNHGGQHNGRVLTSLLRPVQLAGTWTDGRARAAAEATIAVVAVGVRGVVLITALIIAPITFSNANGALSFPYLGAAMLAVVVSMGLCAKTVVTARLRSRPWGIADLFTCFLAIVVCTSVSSRNSSWVLGHFDLPYAINASSVAAGWLRSLKRSLLVSSTIAAALVLAAALTDTKTLAVAVSSAANVVLFGVASAMGAAYLRRLGASFDTLHQQMVDATKRLELERYRLQVHDACGVLRMLADEDTPESALPALRRQARKESLRLRAYLIRDAAHEAVDVPATLADVVLAATDDFTDLPLVVHTALAEEVTLSEQSALLLQRAITTLLYNVRIHANARHVTLHAEQDDYGWELTVHDDGVGFEPRPSIFGYGLQEQVFAALASCDIRVRLTSRPGRGTLVTIAGKSR